MIRDVTPKVCGFPGLPPWLDRPHCKRVAEDCGMTIEEVKEYLFKHGGIKPSIRRELVDERRKKTRIPIDRNSLPAISKDIG